MAKSKKGISVFFLSLIISIALLSGLLLLFLFYTKSAGVASKQAKVPYISEYHPSREESLALLLLGCEKAESLPELATLFYYDAPEGIFYSIIIPTVAVSEVNGRTDTLKGHYEYEGTRGGVNAVKSLLGIELERYARVQATGISNMVDFLGGLPYTVARNMDVGGETILKGEQLLDGRRFSGLLFAQEEGIANCALQSELICKLMERGLTDKLADKYSNLISSVFYNCETNLNQYDFAKRQTGFLNRLKLDSMVTQELVLEGSYTTDRSEFYPDKDNVEKIAQVFQ